jgi:hypothetical protein
MQSTYRRPCRFYHDQAVDTTIEWYWAAPGAQQLALPTVFTSFRQLGDKVPAGDVGEVIGSRVTFTKGLPPHPGLDGTHVEGTPADFLGNGIPPESVLVAGGTLPDNVPCLIAPALGLLAELPQFWQVESAPLGLVGRTDGTYVILDVDWELGGVAVVIAAIDMPVGWELGGDVVSPVAIDVPAGWELGSETELAAPIELGVGWELGAPGDVVSAMALGAGLELGGPGVIVIGIGAGFEIGGDVEFEAVIEVGPDLELGGDAAPAAPIEIGPDLELGGDF